MSFDEKFLKKNCAKKTTISSNGTQIYYASESGWNTCYGNVVIDPQKFPNAQYKWTIVTQRNNETRLRMGIGMISTRNNRNYSGVFWCEKGTNGKVKYPAYYYHSSGSVCTTATTTKLVHSEHNDYVPGDIIMINVNIKTKKITFQKNNKHIDTINIDISTTYVFAVSMSACGMKLQNFEYNIGNAEEKKQNETWQSNLNLEHMVASLQDQLLVKMTEIEQLENIQNDMVENNKKELMKSKRELQTTNNEKQLLKNELNKTRKQLNDCLLCNKQEEEKKDENLKGLQHELIALADKMNAFYIKYDENMLCNIYNNNPYSLFVEQDIDNVSLSWNSLEKRLGEMKNYVISVTKPNVNEYKLWDINTMILWIHSLDNGHFIKYCHVLRKGFEGDCISADDLPNIGQSDLATTPFDIRVFKDRKRLAQHFKSLQQNQVANTNDEGLVTPYI